MNTNWSPNQDITNITCDLLLRIDIVRNLHRKYFFFGLAIFGIVDRPNSVSIDCQTIELYRFVDKCQLFEF